MSRERKWTGLAVDLGASSGRVMAGEFNGSNLELREISRFDNGPVDLMGTIHWDVLRLWDEIQKGIGKGVKELTEAGSPPMSVGVDTWGVDFGLLDRQGKLLGNPVHYRDSRTDNMVEKVYGRIPRDEVFGVTGLQTMQLNTLFQLAALKEEASAQLEQAHALLFMPDMFHYFLSGQRTNEYCIASTSQILDAARREWAWDLIDRLEFPRCIFQDITPPCTVLGSLLDPVKANVGADLKVVAVGSHDTASAVAAVPAAGTGNFAYLSSGTWSLLGAEMEQPVLSARCMELNFTNEGGLGNTIRLLKNIMGLWLLQELRQEWEDAGRDVSWEEMTGMAREARPFLAWIDPDDEKFLAPGSMSGRIRDYCRDTNQPVPETDGALVRCVLESLAFKYRRVLVGLDELAGSAFEVLHIVGGGIQNELLCQFTANAVNRPVKAGPVEGTALGNMLGQLIALGEIDSVAQGREVIANSTGVTDYTPEDTVAWEDAGQRFEEVIRS